MVESVQCEEEHISSECALHSFFHVTNCSLLYVVALPRLSRPLWLMQPSKSNGTGLLWVGGTVMMSSVSCHQWQEKKFSMALFTKAVQMLVKVLWLLINIRKINWIHCDFSLSGVYEFVCRRRTDVCLIVFANASTLICHKLNQQGSCHF